MYACWNFGMRNNITLHCRRKVITKKPVRESTFTHNYHSNSPNDYKSSLQIPFKAYETIAINSKHMISCWKLPPKWLEIEPCSDFVVNWSFILRYEMKKKLSSLTIQSSKRTQQKKNVPPTSEEIKSSKKKSKIDWLWIW